MTTLERHPERMLLQIDVVSAFNNMLREEMLAEMAECFPEWVALFAEWATRTTQLHYILADGSAVVLETCVGVDQGCPGSPVLFAMGMCRALCRARARIEEWLAANAADLTPGAAEAGVTFMSYLDDLSCIVSPECLPAALDIVRDELQQVGVDVNLDKSTCWSPSAPCPTDMALADMWAT